MENIQAAAGPIISQNPSAFKTRTLALFLKINLLLVLINFTLNFMGSPALKPLYLIHIIVTLLAILNFNFSNILPIILTFFFIEGQGRILWANANWTKIIFDSLVLLSIIKIFIENKKLINLNDLPKTLIFLIAFHFLWYLFEFSNLNSISYFAFFAALKIYIFPILLFFGLVQIDFEIYEPKFQKDLNFFIFFIILELALTFYQFSMKESLLLKISSNYHSAMKDSIFTGNLFRPFATSFSPGAISVYFFLTVGFLLLKRNNFIGSILKSCLIFIISAAIIVCQVRSAFIKIAIIIFLVYLGEMLYQRFKAKNLFAAIAFLGLLLTVAPLILEFYTSKIPDLETVQQRILSIKNLETVKKSRLSVQDFTRIASARLIDKPFGMGPGLTGAAGNLSHDAVKESPFLSIDDLWANDNLIISLIIDFGIGAIFYLLLLLYIPFYFTKYLLSFFVQKAYAEFKITLVCFSTIVAVLIGNWGAVGLTYNPESFVFWFFAALGFRNIAKHKNGLVNNIKT